MLSPSCYNFWTNNIHYICTFVYTHFKICFSDDNFPKPSWIIIVGQHFNLPCIKLVFLIFIYLDNFVKEYETWCPMRVRELIFLIRKRVGWANEGIYFNTFHTFLLQTFTLEVVGGGIILHKSSCSLPFSEHFFFVPFTIHYTSLFKLTFSISTYIEIKTQVVKSLYQFSLSFLHSTKYKFVIIRKWCGAFHRHCTNWHNTSLIDTIQA